MPRRNAFCHVIMSLIRRIVEEGEVMDDRSTPRLRKMMDQAECTPDVADGLQDRLSDFLEP